VPETATGARATVALVCRGNSRDPADWSGIPNSLARGLEELGLEVRHVSADLPTSVRRVARRLFAHEDYPALWTAAARTRLRRAGPVDAVLQIGTEFTVTTASPLVTFEDMTVKQHVDLGDDWVTRLPARSIDAWIDRQRRIYEQAAVCCVMSRWAALSVNGDYGIPSAKVRVVGAGANHVVEPPGERDWSVPRFLFIGRDWRRKNLPGVLRAFAALQQEMPAAKLEIVSGAPAEYTPGVTFHGPLRLDVQSERRRLENLFRASTCFVMPSLHEAFGIVYVEAGTAGIPSIGTGVGGAGEAIGPGGRLVHPANEAELLTAMRELSDGETAARLGGMAREHARRFTWAAVAERVASALGLGQSSAGLDRDPRSERP
jgi:glycosyltransferase involved in cell wall biosynthesis